MAEITSVEAIQAKLRQFDEEMEAAIAAAKVLSRIRSDAQKLLEETQNACSRSEDAFKEAEGIRRTLETVRREWDSLRTEFHKSQKDSQEVRDLLLSELDSAVRSLDGKVVEAEERLRTANTASLREHEEMLRQLEHDTRGNAEAASNARAATLKAAEDVHGLVKKTRDELRNDVQSNLNHAQESLDSRFQGAQKDLSDRLEGTVGEINAFKEEMRGSLKEHLQAIDRELTDFLNKQNALVQNLSQQIDSFHRVAQTVASELAQTKADLSLLDSSVKSLQRESNDQSASLSNKIAEVSARLEDTIATLKRRSWLTGFKK